MRRATATAVTLAMKVAKNAAVVSGKDLKVKKSVLVFKGVSIDALIEM